MFFLASALRAGSISESKFTSVSSHVACEDSPVAFESINVRPPRQRRSRESYERVLESAQVLLEENGFDGFTVQEVAIRADVSVGAIYERFGNKETLLRALHARVMDSLASANATIPSAADISDVRTAIAQAVAGVARISAEHRAALRAFMHLGAVDDVIAARGSQSSIELGHVFKSIVLTYRAAINHPDPELAADVAFRMIYCIVARQIMYGPTFESDRPIEWDRLIEEMTAACTAYLLGAALEPPA